ncbi:peptidylprolyl isomerase [Robertkochia sediminum]|uniref:peptidylprolyl isomerase n=1 Tax=Robertkochia sediminum TaxID=2785326 RepID=UPI0019340531|nr:peptidylprolyl isomerase [Robertkochia sediminum]MBL7472531.1 peptidylprolyl isomerase [Robertkochia sediminum]
MKKLFFAAGLTMMMNAMGFAQEADSLAIAEVPPVDSVKVIKERKKIDGVAAVVGDFVILESDIEKQFIDMELQGVDISQISRCEVLGNQMENKLYTHQAIQDSVVVADAEVNSYVESQIGQLTAQLGSIDKVLKFYDKDSEKELRDELFEIVKNAQLSMRMQGKVVEEVEITPEEVRSWYEGLPEEDRPYFGDEVEIAQIIKQPEPSEEEVQKVIDRLKDIKRDVEENGSSFAIKQTLFSEDPGKVQNGGVYSIKKSSNFVQEFKDAAFAMKQGEISDPFKTQFGYHIVYVERVRGEERDVRHILLMPEVSEDDLREAREELEDIRQKIIDGEFTFEEAAQNFSDQKETKFDGGVLRNPQDMSTRFELTKMDPVLYSQVSPLEGNTISQPIFGESQGGKTYYKIIKVNKRFKAHRADYIQDYVKIKELALKEKQLREIGEWMEENIKDTYISVSPSYQGCDFSNNWLKK